MSFEDIIHNKSFDFINALNKTIAGTKVSSPALQDVSLQIIIHLVSCISALRDTLESNDKPKTAMQSQIVAPLLNGLMATVGKVIMDSFAFEPKFQEQEAFATSYCSLMRHAFRLFPDMAVKRHKASGKLLLHHAAFRAKAYIVDDSIQNILLVSPESSSVADNSGALALHWATRNPDITSSGIDLLIQGHPKGVEHADEKGFMPLHWAVNQDTPNMDVVRRLLKVYPMAARTTSRTGNLPLHYCVMRDRPNVTAVKALLAAFPDAISSRCLEGYLPIHRLVHRATADKETLALLIKHYPDSLLQVTEQGQTPLLVALDFPKPDYAAVSILLRACKEAASRADLGDYYPLHMCLDCAKPDYKVALELLKAFPDAAKRETKEGLTPLHLLVSTNVSIDMQDTSLDYEFLDSLVNAYPEALVSVVKDIVPVVGDGVSVAVELLESWSGEWVEQSWDAIGKAQARGMDVLAQYLEEKARPFLPANYFQNNNQMSSKKQLSPTGGAALLSSQPLKTLTPESLSPLTKPMVPPRKFMLSNNNNEELVDTEEAVSLVQPFSVPPEVDDSENDAGYDGQAEDAGRLPRLQSNAAPRPADAMSETAVTVISSLSGSKTNTSGPRGRKGTRAPPSGPIPTTLLQAAENSSAMRLSKSQYELLLGRSSANGGARDGASVSSSGTRRSRVSKKELLLARQQRQTTSAGGYGSDGHESASSVDYAMDSASDREFDKRDVPSSSSLNSNNNLASSTVSLPVVMPVVQPRHRGPPPTAANHSSNNNNNDANANFASKTAPLPSSTIDAANAASSGVNAPINMGNAPRIKRPGDALLQSPTSPTPLIRKADGSTVQVVSPTSAATAAGSNSSTTQAQKSQPTNNTAEVLRSFAPNLTAGKVRVHPQGHDMV